LVHLPTGNSCWSTIIVEDKDAPTFDCPTDPIVISCNEDFANYPAPVATDNCTTDLTINQTDQSIDNSDQCTSTTVTRTWIAFDAAGNASETCTQTIEIIPLNEVNLPADITIDCAAYFADNAVAAPTETGAGRPDVTEGIYCQIAVNHSDDTLAVCGNTFKIIRTWSVLNWCSGELITTDIDGDVHEQIIKILDETPPIITIADITLTANVAGEHPQPCVSTEALPAAEVSDACSDIESVQIFTPVGMIDNNGGNIPDAGLSIGVHPITYVATDVCGNESEVTITLTVIDGITPLRSRFYLNVRILTATILWLFSASVIALGIRMIVWWK